jgi:hypothetical protein
MLTIPLDRSAVWLLWVLPFLLLFYPVGTYGQSVAVNFESLRTKVNSGDTVYVLAGQERETKGRVVQVSPSSLVVLVDGERRDFSPLSVNAVWRRGDSVLNGLAIGAVAGVLAGGFLGGRNPGEKNKFWPQAGAVGGLVGSGLGAAVDAIIPGKRLVYRKPPGSSSGGMVISPVFSSEGVGVRLTARF